MNTVRAITDGLWQILTPVKFAGVHMPARTVVVELGSGGVLVHSPGRLDDEVRAAIDRIGPVRGLIAPNCFHHLFVDDWRTAYPDAELHIAPGLAKKRSDLEGQPLTDTAPALWAGEIEQHVWGGIPMIGEVVFVHKPTRTLLNTDMMHNMHYEQRWFARTAWRMLGSYGRFGPSRLERWLAKDRAALRTSIDRVLEWDFDRVTVAHGDVLECGGKDSVRDGWTWVPSHS
jgi:hypothetical protein